MKIYNFDHCITSTPDKRILDNYMKARKSLVYQNPLFSSKFSSETKDVIDRARFDVARLINAAPEEIFFVSSGAEANNLAIKGYIKANIKKGNRVITNDLEHQSVQVPLKSLAADGVITTGGACLSKIMAGLFDEFESLFDEKVILTTAIHGNSENAMLLPIEKLSKIAAAKNSAIHVDACFTAGRVRIDVKSSGVSTLSLSGHKLGAVPGAAALYIRRGTRIFPQIEGGLEENGLRAGFYNVAAISSLGFAARIAADEFDTRNKHFQKLREIFINAMDAEIKNIKWVCGINSPVPSHISFCLDGINAETVAAKLSFRNILVSPTSWCVNFAGKVSPALKLSGLEFDQMQSYLRICPGRSATEKDMVFLAKSFAKIYRDIKKGA